MPKAYSIDLRERVVAFVNAGHSCRATAAHFLVSVSFVVKIAAAFRARGDLATRPWGGRRHAKLEPHRDFLIARVAARDDITMSELAADLLAATGVKAAPSSLSRWFIRQGYSVKKNPSGQRTRSLRRGRGTHAMDRTAPTQDAA